MNMQDDLPDESDTSDEDYDPGIKEDDVSEVDSDGDPEEPLSDSENSNSRSKKKRKGKSKAKKPSKAKPNVNECSKENKVEVKGNDDDQKKKEEDLWADFMKDTGFVSKSNTKAVPKSCSSESKNTTSGSKDNNCKSSEKSSSAKPVEKVKIKQVFDFAGEEVEIEKEVPVDSAEARILSKNSNDLPKNSKTKRPAGLTGIGNVLSQLTKKPKISTLEKTKVDWDRFKKEEKLEEELLTYNKGKDGYLDRQDFLERADLRRFEIEKDLRTMERNKRFNSTL